MNFLKKFTSVAVILTCALNAFAQEGINLKMKLADANDEPVSFATVSLTVKGSDKPAKYVLSGEDGSVLIEKVKKGSYIVKAELMGFKPFTQEVKIEKSVDLGKVVLELDATLLDAASVSATGNPIVVKKDTVEYNASSFRTTDNDMLEDLLKKLPGVEVSSDGSVTANGKTISKITIDGKTFFLDDPSLASKNIPAKLVEKVKVVEKKSDQAIFTGIDDGEEETIIDLSVKRGMMDGWIGNLMGGGGLDIPVSSSINPDGRYQAAGMVGNFSKKSQISVIVNANNTNNRGFNDMAGSMMQSMRGGGGGMGRGAGMGSGNGITTSWMGGANGAWTLLDDKMDLAGNYLYNGTNRLVQEQSSKVTYLDNNNTLTYNKKGTDNTISNGHRFGIRLEHKFSDKTSILFEPQLNFGKGSYNELSADTTYSNTSTVPTNKGFTSSIGDNSNWTTSGRLLFRQRFDKPGRTISVNLRYSFSNNILDGFNQSLSQTWKETEWTGTPTNQRIASDSKSSSLSARVSYVEPLGGDFYMEASYQYGWNNNKSVKDVYNSGYFDPSTFGPGNLIYNKEGETYDKTYSNNITNTYQTHNAGLNVQLQKKKLRAQLGAAFRPTITDNVTNGETYSSTVYNWSPQAMFNYDFNDNTDLRIFYRGNQNQPSTSQLMPVPDNSNPLSISFGNPYLKPYFNHSLRGNFGYTNKQTFFSIHGHFNASLVQNGIQNALWYDNAGVQYAMPINGETTGSASLGAFLNAPIAKSNFSISNMLNINFNSSASYVGISSKSEEFTKDYYDKEKATFNYKQFNADFFDHSQAGSRNRELSEFFNYNRNRNLGITERLRGTYRNDFVELNLGGRVTVNKPWYTLATSGSANTTWNNAIEASMLWTIPGGVGLNADCDYRWYRGYTTEQDPSCVLNVEITKLLFKNKFTISLKAYDLLNQTKNLYVSDTSNYHQETRNNSLGRYVILSLTYRFGNFSKAGQNMRGPGGRGGGPGGPGGPPPGR